MYRNDVLQKIRVQFSVYFNYINIQSVHLAKLILIFDIMVECD